MIVNPKEKMIEYVYEKRIVCSVQMHHPFGVNASSVHPERIIRLGHTHHSFGIDVSSVFRRYTSVYHYLLIYLCYVRLVAGWVAAFSRNLLNGRKKRWPNWWPENVRKKC